MSRKTFVVGDIDKALDEITVEHRDEADLTVCPWWPAAFPYAVSTPDTGIEALFANEADANRYRLFLVAMILNPREGAS